MRYPVRGLALTIRPNKWWAVLALCAVLAVMLAAYLGYFGASGGLGLDAGLAARVVGSASPEILYAFGRTDTGYLVSPVGVTAHDGSIFVADSALGKVEVFDESGRWQRSIGGTECVVPVYVAADARGGKLLVSDRRTNSIHVYTIEGVYLGDFEPDLIGSEDGGGRSEKWTPNAIAFGPDGALYVTDLARGHRLHIFDRRGRLARSVESFTDPSQPGAQVDGFDFPNGLMITEDEIYVADSNNNRVVVLSHTGEFRRTIKTRGLPRGIAALRYSSRDESRGGTSFVVVDTFAHALGLWGASGERILEVGDQGPREGQFNFPNGVAVDRRGRIIVADTANSRVQVWGWVDSADDTAVSPLWYLGLLLVPIVGLVLFRLFGTRRFFATADFVERLIELEELDAIVTMSHVRWVTSAREYDVIAGLVDEQTLDLFELAVSSEGEIRSLRADGGLDPRIAEVLAAARDARVICTEDVQTREAASVIGIETMDAHEFVETYAMHR